jgi:hypothetical protein
MQGTGNSQEKETEAICSCYTKVWRGLAIFPIAGDMQNVTDGGETVK